MPPVEYTGSDQNRSHETKGHSFPYTTPYNAHTRA